MKILLVNDISDSSLTSHLINQGDEVVIYSSHLINDFDIVYIFNISKEGELIINKAHKMGKPIFINITNLDKTRIKKKVYKKVDAFIYKDKDIRQKFQKLIKRRTNSYILDNDFITLRKILLEYSNRPISETGKYFYYRDYKNDDFANTNIKTKYLDEDFKIINQNKFYNFIAFILYYIIAKPIIFLLNKIYYHQKIVNKKVLKICKHQGYFIYSNHTAAMGDAFTPNLLTSKRNYIIASHDAFSLKGLKNVVLMLGGLPVFKSGDGFINYVNSMNYRIKQNRSITIYPEAHIWPYYTDIRSFTSGSFRYPYDMNAPIYCLTNTWVKSKVRKKPKLITYVDGPFYRDLSLKREEGIDKLRDLIFMTMKDRSNNINQYEYIKYIKVDI